MTGDRSLRVDELRVGAYRIPTDRPESDGTFAWDSTTIVVVEVDGGGCTGVGYTYGAAALVALIDDELAALVTGADPRETECLWEAMSARLRNVGRRGAGMMAISAVDIALWDLRARLAGTAVTTMLGPARPGVPVYGSGGFTTYTPDEVADQLGGWVEAGIPRVKIKVGRHPEADPARLAAARGAIGDDTELFVDANGAFSRKSALAWAYRYRDEWDVTWFEEPVSSEDVVGLRQVRTGGPPGLDVAAGEYGSVPGDFRILLEQEGVDCLQADVTRCGGISGVQRVIGLADAFHVDVSGHCAPAVSAHAFAPAVHLRHLEYFHDHVRVERMLFDGVLEPRDGRLYPDAAHPGLGLAFRREEAERWAVASARRRAA